MVFLSIYDTNLEYFAFSMYWKSLKVLLKHRGRNIFWGGKEFWYLHREFRKSKIEFFTDHNF